MPTLPSPRRLTGALDAQLDLSVDPDEMSLSFVPHTA